ncbi:MAG TPA: ATP-binding protein [Candidatus Saccharimonadales bacterium]|nr:ATP-binding protein [Candidatus Saccharimonadales bacterium]
MMIYLLALLILLFLTLIVFVINYSYSHAVKKAQVEIFSSLNEAAIVLDAKGTILLFNERAEKLVNITTKDAIGKNIDTIVKLYTDETLIPYSVYGVSSDATKKQNFTFSLLLDNGNKTQVLMSVSKNLIGRANQTLITLLDTSQEKQLEEMKVDFVSMAAHELRTPLTAIRGYASLMQMHYAQQLDNSARELLTRLIVSTTTLTNLIDNLLSVSRIERNDLIIEGKPIDMGVIIKDIYTSYKQEAAIRKQQFILNLPPNLPLVMADPFRIGQVFINLIGNAITYTPEGGKVTITVSVKTDHLEFAIQDTGEGIPKDAMPRLFTKFFRVSGSLEQGSKGSGLGLYITKSIIELHHGKIWADSILGHGTTFTFTIPMATEEQKANDTHNLANNAFLTVKNGQSIIIRNSPMKVASENVQQSTNTTSV